MRIFGCVWLRSHVFVFDSRVFACVLLCFGLFACDFILCLRMFCNVFVGLHVICLCLREFCCDSVSLLVICVFYR